MLKIFGFCRGVSLSFTVILTVVVVHVVPHWHPGAVTSGGNWIWGGLALTVPTSITLNANNTDTRATNTPSLLRLHVDNSRVITPLFLRRFHGHQSDMHSFPVRQTDTVHEIYLICPFIRTLRTKTTKLETPNTRKFSRPKRQSPSQPTHLIKSASKH